jgi:hypothetical protein
MPDMLPEEYLLVSCPTHLTLANEKINPVVVALGYVNAERDQTNSLKWRRAWQECCSA